MEWIKSFFNEHEVDLKIIGIVIVVMIGAALLTRVARWLIARSFKTASEKLKVDPTRYKFFKNGISLIIWLIAVALIVSTIPKLKTLAITLLASAGILVAILGFAAQQAFANIISGVFIVIFRPFRVGDLIKVGALESGLVEDITLRHTVIKSFENKRIIIPNSVISNETIVNEMIEDNIICRWIEVDISYESDVDLALDILSNESAHHPSCVDVRTEEELENKVPKVVVRVIKLGEYSILLRAYVWTADPIYAVAMQSDILRSVKKRYEEVGIEIPYPYRNVITHTKKES